MTDKNEKLFNAIGKLNDSYIEEAYAENPQPAKSRKSIKRIVMLAAAALLSVSLVITVAANSDAIIAAMFERRQKLVDDKIGHIDESVTEGNITLTMESVKVDRKIFEDGQFACTYTVSFHNDGGVFDNGLKYGGYKLEVLVEPDDPRLTGTEEEGSGGRKWYSIESYVTTDGVKKVYCPFDVDMKRLNYGLDNPSDTITLSSASCYGSYNADYRMTFIDLTSFDGSKKYADKLSVEFKVTEDDAPPLQQLDSYKPDTSFEIDGATFEIYDIQVNADHMNIKIANPKADRVNIAGTDCYAINYFTKLACSDEYFEKNKQLVGMSVNSEESMNLITEIFMLSLPSTDQNILNECYEIMVEINPDSGAEITSIGTGIGGFSGEAANTDNIFAQMYAEFSSPIYVNDIVRVYAQKIGDPTKQVTIWVPAEDEGLAELNK